MGKGKGKQKQREREKAKNDSELSEEEEPRRHKRSKIKRSKSKFTFNPLIAIIIGLIIALITSITLFLLIHFNVIDWFNSTEKQQVSTSTMFPTTINTSIPAQKAITKLPKPKKKTVNRTAKRTSTFRTVCDTPECKTLADQLNTWGNLSIDPCTDFYQATCGSYMKNLTTPYPRKLMDGRLAEKTKVLAGLVRDHIYKKKKDIPASEKVMKEVHVQCELFKDPKEREKGFKYINEKVKKIVHRIFYHEDGYLFELLSRDSEQYVMDFGYFRVDFVDDKFIIKPPDFHRWLDYETLKNISNVHLNGVKGKKVHEVKHAIDLLVIHINNFKYYGRSDNGLVTLGQLDRHLEYNIDFDNLFKRLLSTENYRRSSFYVVDSSHFFNGWFKNYAKTRFINLFPFTVGFSRISQLYRQFEEVFDGDCDEMLLTQFPAPSMNILTKTYFNRTNFESAAGIVELMKTEYTKMALEKMLRAGGWEDLLPNAIRKLTEMQVVPSIPEGREWEEKLEELYTLADQKFPNHRNDTDNFLRKLRYVKAESFGHVITRNSPVNLALPYFEEPAWYDKGKNVLTLNIPFLTPVHFHESLPQIVKLATIGTGLAHGIGHVFDVDSYGYVNGYPSPTFRRGEYINQHRCWNKQYREYTKKLSNYYFMPDTTVFWEYDSLNQVIADQLGLEASWKVYKNLVAPFNISHLTSFENDRDIDKLFFRIYALDFCAPPSTTDNETLKWYAPVVSFRVNGIVANSPAFSEAFQCKRGSPMNLEIKCRTL